MAQDVCVCEGEPEGVDVVHSVGLLEAVGESVPLLVLLAWLAEKVLLVVEFLPSSPLHVL